MVPRGVANLHRLAKRLEAKALKDDCLPAIVPRGVASLYRLAKRLRLKR
ncbi:hypothetical protein H650_09705 [Enterobacter sp. R4-368]|nr:hypothetical protein H650_09705 [Enterobacter sp. R4-368]